MKARLIWPCSKAPVAQRLGRGPASDGVDLQALWCHKALRRDGRPSPDGPRPRCGHMKAAAHTSGQAYEGFVATVTPADMPDAECGVVLSSQVGTCRDGSLRERCD